ncbi:divisome protein SepX/GlpR [Corynebacterium cystitidis]|uniref:divisome protein SepX/GlpR n=1 Tax=Corynebacterium cystitidis TaxID=35757 RepID=UPI00211E5423|nr:gephyrin-like molybdotransferase receptor GlpR [Corynebacterium cystitidis]
MSGSLMIVLIVVVWLFVLAPLVFGGASKPIRRSGEAYDETRVLHQGGTEPVQPRRRPKLTRADVRYDDDDDALDLEVVEVDAEPAGSTLWIDDTDLVRDQETFAARAEDTIEGELVDDQPEDTSDSGVPTGEEESEYSNEDAEDAEGLTYETHESYLTPEDLGFESSGSTVISILDSTQDVNEDSAELTDPDDKLTEPDDELTDPDDELTDEELAFAESRRGRGGWDPVADKTHRVTRYQRRQRTFFGLCVALAVGGIFALIAGGWAWAAPAVVVGIMVWYLIALRALVRQEQELRLRRVRQLRRARLGVRFADKEAPIPAELRRPGAIIVELDDESPDFDYLPVTSAHVLHSDDDTDAPTPVPGAAERRVG